MLSANIELTQKGLVVTIFDPACGTGGMLSTAEEYLRELNPDSQTEVFGQELILLCYCLIYDCLTYL
ncbi:MAG: hypothetical protein D5S00_00745, partial [Tindallia sp. MSAO_Bac2]